MGQQVAYKAGTRSHQGLAHSSLCPADVTDPALLQGALFHDRMKAPVLDTVRPELLAMEQAYEAAHPGVKIQKVPPPKINKGFGSK
jgi:hypothetical protein